jgi:hypothetical protein
MTANPYGKYVEGLDVLKCLEDTPARIESLVRGWPREKDEHSHAPGKWTARQIVVHLAQSELALTTRVRFAASAPGYVAQPFDQDAWIALDHADGPTAVDAYVALRRFNLAMFKNMSPKLRKQPFTHPEYGELTPDWVAAQLAGHELHHLRQLKQIK